MAINRNKVLAAARRHVRRGNWEKAIDQYQLLVDDDPADERSLLKIADLYAKLDRRDEALSAYLRVARHYAADEFFEKAVAVYVQAQRLAPDSPELNRDLGDAYYRLGRLKDAVRAYHKAQKIYRERKNVVRQRELLERMIELDPDDIGLRIQLAERYAKDQLRDKALELFEYCADRLDQEGRLDEFLQVAERIIYLKDEAPALRRRVIDIYLGRADYRSALSHLQVCFKRHPQDQEVLERLAQAFLRLDRPKKALLVLHELANQQRVARQPAQVLQTYQRILEIDPEDAQARARINVLRRRKDSGGMVTPEHHTGRSSPRRDTPAPAAMAAEEQAEEVDPLAGIEFLDASTDDVHVLAPQAQEEMHRESASRREKPTAPHPAIRRDGREQRSLPTNRHRPAEAAASPARSGSAEQAEDLAQASDALEELELLDVVDPTVEHDVADQVDIVAKVVRETDVFIKYGLYDKAYETVVGLIAQHPNNLKARAQMARLQQIRKNPNGAVDELLEMARITRPTPRQSSGFLEKALSLTQDRPSVLARARAMGLSLDAHQDQEEAGATDEVFLLDEADLVDEEQLAGEALEAAHDEDSEGYEAGHTDRIELTEEALGFRLDQAGDIQPISSAPLEEPGTEELEMDDVDLVLEDIVPDDELILLDEWDDELIVLDEEVSGFEQDLLEDVELLEFEVGGVSELDFDESAFEDADLVEMDVDVDDLGELDEVEFGALSDQDRFAQDASPGFDLSEEEADQIFDDLFGDFDEDKPAPAAALAGADAELEAGLADDTEELSRQAAEAAASENAALKRARRGSLRVEENPFGARSLSQKFVPAAELERSREVAPGIAEAHNTSLELGLAYRDLGLIDEAILEFDQAKEDPDAAHAARFHIALCELDRGAPDEAISQLEALLQEQDLPEPIRQAASQQLEELAH